MRHTEALDTSPGPDEITALATDLAERATRLADACKQLAAHRDTDGDCDALTAALADFEGEDG